MIYKNQQIPIYLRQPIVEFWVISNKYIYNCYISRIKL